MQKKIKWGIMGPGRIAHKFAQSLKCSEAAEMTAVGSRSIERAEKFAKEYGVSRSYGSYADLAADTDVDIIYVATPHPAHFECTMLCLKAGKAVLCEKPFTLNASETKVLIKTARASKLFLMEAMWMRYLPAIVKVRELLTQGAIGETRMVKADFGNRIPWEPAGSFASMVLGASPTKLTGVAYLGETGVDEQFSAVLGYEAGKIATLSGAVRTSLINEARIIGTDGYIRVPDFWRASTLELYQNGKMEKFELPFRATGYIHEAEEAMYCLREGLTESSVMPLDESLKIMKILDTLRKQWGLKYPQEK
jgi:predicted dehydrogenase